MVDVGGRNVDDLKKLGDKMKVVSGNIKELLIPSHLGWDISNMW